MRRAFIHFQRTNLRFRRWSRAKYAAFVSIHRQVTMGQLVSSLADRFYAKQALLHGGMRSSERNQTLEETRCEVAEEEDRLSALLPMDRYALLSTLEISQHEASVDASRIGFHLIFVFILHGGWVS